MGTVEALEILSPGPLTTIQDLGRYGFGRYGVPPSGALDAFSLRAANLLVDNHENEAGLEITLMGLKVRVLTDLVIAVTGADLSTLLNGRACAMWRAHAVHKEDVLHFKALRSGCRAYLSIGGGISIDPMMGSKSTNIISRFGGHEGRALKSGDLLHSESPHLHSKAAGRTFLASRIPQYSNEWVLRILWGPRDDEFPENSKRFFVESLFSVTPKSDRTGIRLSGPAIQRKERFSESIISEGVVPGSIQVPGDAQPIIILVETVTGGYRKIATVISADLPLLGQCKPGDRVLFRPVPMEEALLALREMEKAISSQR